MEGRLLLIICLLLAASVLVQVSSQADREIGSAEELNRLQLDLGVVKAEKSSLQSQLDQAQASHKTQVGKLEEVSRECAKSTEAFAAEAKSLAGAVATAGRERDESKAELALLRKQQNTKQAETAVFAKKAKDLEESMARVQQTQEGCSSRVMEAEAQLEEAQSALKTKTDANQKLVVDVRTSADAMSKCLRETKLLKDRYALAIRRTEEQQAMIKSLQAMNDEAASVIQRLKRNPLQVLLAKVASLKSWLFRCLFRKK
ncbi:hypothetical protein B484DRAFT_444312 [Ochromonadaceae sp. CCMP2298]|nr:hypothetical protein B484DRAFT_444312 [Ochromonadaceae sp. CCMP2298]